MSRLLRHRILGSVVVLAVAGTVVVGWVVLHPRPAAPLPAMPAKETRRVIAPAALPAQRTLVGQALDGRDRPASGSALDAVLGADSSLTFAQRIAALRALPTELTEADHTALLAVVTGTWALPPLTPVQARAFKNDILNALGRQPAPDRLADVAAVLRRLAADPAQDPVMRDYALQHLADLGPSMDDGSAHLAAVAGAEPALAATALLHLVARERTGTLTAEMRERATAAALTLAGDTLAPETSRATALQVCARLKLSEARALAYELARSTRASVPLRIAAIATLGDLGGDIAVRDYLASLVDGRERRLRVPAESALKRFSLH